MLMIDLEKKLVKFIAETSTHLPEDIISKINEIDNPLKEKLLKNIELAKKYNAPICQDTGTPIFYVKYSKKYSQLELKKLITSALNSVSKNLPLRPNAVDITDKNIGNVPIIHFEEIGNGLTIDLMFKGGGSENIGATYKLPDESLDADRNINGIKKCVIDAVFKAQGKGCPPYIIGIATGALKDQTAFESKKQLLRKLDEPMTDFEKELYESINKLDIGILGLGKNGTNIGVKFKSLPRHPASYFVDISFGCWVTRRGCLIIEDAKIGDS